MRTAINTLVLSLLVALTLGQTAISAEPAQSVNPQIFAHRGGKKWAPENTLSAFKQSVEASIDGIELDIHKCKSGELVVIHDDTLERTTNGAGLVKDKTWSELKALDCGSWYNSAFKDERLPLLSEVLALVQGKLTINIEIKNCPMNYAGIADDLLALLKDYKYPDKIIISSFDHKVLQEISQKSKRYKIAMLGDSVIADLPQYAHSVGARHWNPAFDCVRSDTVADAHKNGLTVNTWTVNDQAGWQKARELCVDTIITDDPVGLKDYLQKSNK